MMDGKQQRDTIMDSKLKVLLLYIVYPLAMGTYFKRALERRTDIDLKVVGPYSGTYIPWLGGMTVSPKYAIPPDVPLPHPALSRVLDYNLVKAQLGDWKPDLVLNADAGICWKEKPSDGYTATIATDPHVLDYSIPRSYSDKFFNMQKCYSAPGDIWLPYAYDPTVFHPMPEHPLTYDACLVGMPYQQREAWKQALQRKGVNVFMQNGPIFDEARELYASSKIGLNWSSLNDLNARVFEVMAMGLPLVTNRVPDLLDAGFVESGNYLGFSDLTEAVEQVMWLRDHSDDALVLGQNALRSVKPHTYDARIGQILEECEF